MHSTVNAKGEFVVFGDDGKKMTKKALAQRKQVETRHPLGLYVTSDEDGTRHFWRGDDEITEDVWIQQHPHLRRGKDSGGNQDSGLGPVGDNGVEPGSEAESIRQGIRDERAKAKAGAGQASNRVGQPGQRPQQT